MTATAQGTALRCRSWRAEALLRLLENVLEVAERPDDLVVYASLGKAARDWPAYRQIVEALLTIEEGQTLVLQTGRPIGIMRTHPAAPLVVSAVNNTVGRWATEEKFYRRMAEGKTIWGGLTAAAWQYIGRQGVLQGTYELLRAVLRKHFGEQRSPQRWMLTAGLGGMGSAQPISAALLQLSSLTAEVDRAKLDRLATTGGLDLVTPDLDVALDAINRAVTTRTPIAVGLHANASWAFPEIARRVQSGAAPLPDLVTDQTAAHDARYGYLPAALDLEDWPAAVQDDPLGIERSARQSMAEQVRAMVRLAACGAVVFENGNNLRVQASLALSGAESERAFATIPGFMEAYLRPLFCRGIGPFRWILLSGSTRDQDVVDDLAVSMFSHCPEVAEWISLARQNIPQQGLPARSCWLGYGERSALAVAVNDAVREGRIGAPVAFTRDHLDSAGMTHPRIGTEKMKDDSDGVTDWPILDAMLVASAGADLVAVHSGGGGYAGWMQSCGLTVVADGSPEAERRLRLALDLDSGLGVLRYATAGYLPAVDEVARSHADDSPGPPLHHLRN